MKKHYYQHSEKWFLDRVGKRLYRKKLRCSCSGCQRTHVDVLSDEHARTICLNHNELGIKYYDKPVVEE